MNRYTVGHAERLHDYRCPLSLFDESNPDPRAHIPLIRGPRTRLGMKTCLHLLGDANQLRLRPETFRLFSSSRGNPATEHSRWKARWNFSKGGKHSITFPSFNLSEFSTFERYEEQNELLPPRIPRRKAISRNKAVAVTRLHHRNSRSSFDLFPPRESPTYADVSPSLYPRRRVVGVTRAASGNSGRRARYK